MVTHLRSMRSHTERQLKEQLLTNHPLARRRHQWKPARPGPRDPHTRPHEGSYCRNTVAPKAAGQHKRRKVKSTETAHRPIRGKRTHTTRNGSTDAPKPWEKTVPCSDLIIKDYSKNNVLFITHWYLKEQQPLFLLFFLAN